MKRKTIKIAIVLVLSLVLLSNIVPFRYMLSYIIDFSHDRYSNASGTFTFIDMTGNSPKTARRKFSFFLEAVTCDADEKVLYRTFYRNLFAFWRYYSYGDDKYDIPYKSWHSIKKARENKKKIKPLNKRFIQF